MMYNKTKMYCTAHGVQFLFQRAAIGLAQGTQLSERSRTPLVGNFHMIIVRFTSWELRTNLVYQRLLPELASRAVPWACAVL